MTNLFAWRATDPKEMMKVSNPVGEEGVFFSEGGSQFCNRNDLHLYTTGMHSKVKVACWGVHGGHLYRAAKLRQWFFGLSYLKLTKGGVPQHPLYLKANLQPQPLI